MDQDQSKTGPELADAQERSPQEVREEIEETRAELGNTVAALAEKSDVKAQAKGAVNEAWETMSAKVSEVKETVTETKDEFVSSARRATPDSARDAGQRVAGFAQQNSLLMGALAAFGLGLLVGRRSAR